MLDSGTEVEKEERSRAVTDRRNNHSLLSISLGTRRSPHSMASLLIRSAILMSSAESCEPASCVVSEIETDAQTLLHSG